jgi:hypothetical protein
VVRREGDAPLSRRLDERQLPVSLVGLWRAAGLEVREVYRNVGDCPDVDERVEGVPDVPALAADVCDEGAASGDGGNRK